MKNLKAKVVIIAIIFAIPIIGFLISVLVSHGYEKKYENTVVQIVKEDKGVDLSNDSQFLEKIKLDNICKGENLSPTLLSICSDYEGMGYLGQTSIVTLFFTIGLFMFIFTLGFLSRKRRNVLFYLFRPGLLISQICTAILVIANSGIVVFSIYFGESFYFGRIHVGLILALGIASFFGVLQICIITLKPIRNVTVRVFGKILHKDSYPSIWSFIELIAKQIGTTAPDYIIVGMDPTFFVTETGVMCLDGEIKGKVLFLSLPFCRVLTEVELTAIIGHEMGHFVGEDTKWSRKFYPIYRGATETAFAVSVPDGGLVQLAFMPALLFMGTFINAFEKSEKEISRERELNADKIGAKITSQKIMAAALLKTHIYEYAWAFTQNKMGEALSQGKCIVNIAEFFSTVCELLPDNFMINEIGKSCTPHPTDSHPHLSARLDSLGVQLSELYSDGIKLHDAKRAIELIEKADILERELSNLEHHKLIKSGTIKVDEGKDVD